MTEIITGHTSQATAYVVDDYPYGFRLRCKIRYWLEYNPKKGFRLVSQTTNPRQAGEHWNKSKASTYCDGPSFLTRNSENNHIGWMAYHLETLDAAKAEDLLVNLGDKLPVEYLPKLRQYIIVKREYDLLKATGMPFQVAGSAAIRHTLPASSLRSEFRAEVISHFQSDPEKALILTGLLYRGTIGELEDFLCTTTFRKENTHAL